MLLILKELAFRVLDTSNVSGAYVFRTLHSQGGTALLTTSRSSSAAIPAAKTMTASNRYCWAGTSVGERPIGWYRLLIETTSRDFEVYGCKAFTSVASLPSAVASRCIPIPRTAPAGNPKNRVPATAHPHWQRLRDDLHLLTLDNAETWLESPKNLDSCPEVTGRYVELWQPILVLAAWIDKLAAEGAMEKGLLSACTCIAPTQSRSTRPSAPWSRRGDQQMAQLLRTLAARVTF